LLGQAAADLPLGRLHYHRFMDFRAGIASGSFLTGGMVICPCSMGTAAAVAHGLSQNLIHRAADVHLKERRRLVLVPRETPLGLVQLRNLALCAEAGATVLPAMPALYTHPGARRRGPWFWWWAGCGTSWAAGRACPRAGARCRLGGGAMSETSHSLLERLRRRPDADDWRRLVELYEPLLRTWLGRQGVQGA